MTQGQKLALINNYFNKKTLSFIASRTPEESLIIKNENLIILSKLMAINALDPKCHTIIRGNLVLDNLQNIIKSKKASMLLGQETRWQLKAKPKEEKKVNICL
jgi:hypothetical protein